MIEPRIDVNSSADRSDAVSRIDKRGLLEVATSLLTARLADLAQEPDSEEQK
jgi:hypothetical protein